MELSNQSTLKYLLARHGFTFSKSLGQNFIINPGVCPRMAEACTNGTQPFGVLEIGPGIGVLTRALSQQADKVVTIELDRRLLPILSETLSDCPNVTVLWGDALRMDLAAVIEEHFAGMPVAVCANLPYYITSPLLMRLLETQLPLENITVMVQKEAAARLCARPGERACGAVSAAVQYYSTPEILFSVGRGSFLPMPKVDSAVIRLTLRSSPPISPKSEAAFFACVKAAFAMRRKTVLNAVSAAFSIEKPVLSNALLQSKISPLARAEALDMDGLCRLSDTVFSLRPEAFGSFSE